ncbi:MAG: NAD(P)-dependent oxidoreductase [Patescibacteria group bacterium]|nr:NAD(P)-dependent oxidoreductase [Patescibacteria group bacterium]
MKCLITGGGGYLATWLAEALLKCGHGVRALDVHFDPGRPVPFGVEMVKTDIRDRLKVRRALGGIDLVFHLAFVQSMSQMPLGVCEDINIGGMKILLEESLRAGVKRFVHTSTIEIYGTKPPVPCMESASQDDPVGWYGEHKKICEEMLWQFCADTGLSATALRMPTICGPGFYNHRGLLGLMDRILDTSFVIKIDDGDTLADLVHYEDVIQGYLLAAEHPEAVGRAFNISCRKSSSHRQIIRAMRRAVRSPSRVLRVPKYLASAALWFVSKTGWVEIPDDQRQYLEFDQVYDSGEARRLLGYDPKMSSAEAAAELIRYYARDRDEIRQRSRNY